MLDRIASDRLAVVADRITARITELVRAILEKRSIARSIDRDDELNECGISSLDMVNLMLAVEAEFDVKIPDRDMTPANFRSVARIEALVEKLKPGA